MIAGLSSAALPYLRPASTSGSNATTTSDLQPEASTATDAATSSPGISVSQLKPLQGAKPISVAKFLETVRRFVGTALADWPGLGRCSELARD